MCIAKAQNLAVAEKRGNEANNFLHNKKPEPVRKIWENARLRDGVFMVRIILRIGKETVKIPLRVHLRKGQP